MHRMFGRSAPKKQGPNLEQTSERLGARGDSVEAKINKIESELAQCKEQLKTARGGSKQRIKQRAMQLLKQKRMYEGHRDSIYNQQFNVDQVSFTQSSLKDNLDTVQTMKSAAKEMKKQYSKISVEDVEKVQDDMEDMMFDAEEIQDALGRSYGAPEVDDEDLMDELGELEDQMTMEDSSYLDVNIPSGSVKNSGESQGNKSMEAEM
eukprot:gb/GECH01011810.1/.p1 GENE.gb/GECH01011810.1/~~gb/GECH01011810.1/.p1  ORF type:complete len:207 (+),score=74.98 gb/GECH01011810.1/:1-621(+)